MQRNILYHASVDVYSRRILIHRQIMLFIFLEVYNRCQFLNSLLYWIYTYIHIYRRGKTAEPIISCAIVLGREMV